MLRPRASLFIPILMVAVLLSSEPAGAQSGNIVLRLCIATPPGSLCRARELIDVPVQTNELSTPSGPFYWALLVGLGYGEDPFPPFVGGNGIRTIGGLECGIDYSGAYEPNGGASPICVFGWTNQGDLEFPSGGWPAPGSGNLITWTEEHCYHVRGGGVTVALAGYFYLAAYAPAQLRVIPRPVSGAAKLARCDASEVDITPPLNNCGLGMIGFGMAGFNGICAVPVETTTWSRLKAYYRS